MAKTDTTKQIEPAERDKAAIDDCKSALGPLANLAVPDPTTDPATKSVPATYRINRCGEQCEITPADIEEARACIADPAATLERCRAALRPLAKLPRDFRVTDPLQVLYSFRGRDGKYIGISHSQIDRARRLA